MIAAILKFGVFGLAVKELLDHAGFLRAAAPYRTRISLVAQEYGLSPHLLASIFWKESRFNPKAVGRDGEIGMGQFMEIAARDVGLDIETIKNSVSTQIDATARLMQLNLKRFGGNLFDALRAYNVGSGRARKDTAAGSGYAADVIKSMLLDKVWGLFA